MAPNHEAEKPDRAHRIDHRLIAEDGLARKRRDNMRRNAHARKNRDVDLRMAEEPEEVLPQQRRAASVVDELVAHHEARRDEEACSAHAVEQQQDARGKEHGEGKQHQDGRDKPSPTGERQAHEREAARAQVERGGDEVQRA